MDKQLEIKLTVFRYLRRVLAVASKSWQHPEYRVTAKITQGGLSVYSPKKGSSLDPLYLLLLAATILTGTFTIAALLIYFAAGSEPISWENPLSSLGFRTRASERSQFFASLNREEERKLASQVHYVASIIERVNKNVDTRKDIAVSIVSESIKANYDPFFVAAIVKAESTFKSHAVSSKGARGFMQLMPTTEKFARSIRSTEFFPGIRDLKSADINIEHGIAYFKHLEELFNGDRELALIAYNWGPGNLKSALKKGKRIPAGPVSYARKILTNHAKWRSDYNMIARQLHFVDIEALA